MRMVLPTIAIWLLPLASATGQQDSGAEPTLVRPPQLKQLIPAKLPPGVAFPAPEVEVLLEIEVAADGKVTDVRVQSGTGEPFDSAALEAATQFEFEPALLSTGETTPVTITFRMRIQQPVEPPRPPPPAPVRFSGQLIERGTRTPLAGVEVEAREGTSLLARTASDAQGRFVLEVAEAVFELVATPAGHMPLAARVEMQPGEERSEIFYLETTGGGFETVVRADAVRREVTVQVIPKQVVERLAGTQGDTLKVVQNLPGVGRASFGAGTLILRGASPEDSRVFLEGQEIPILYHFGGLRSTFHSAFLEAVEFTPGSFGPEYGRAIGGIIDVRVRDPDDSMFRGNVDLNFYDAGFALEGPLGDGWSVGGAFHRSYIDTLLPLFLPDDAPLSFNTAPRYYDYQVLASYRPDARNHVRLIWYGSMDKVELLFSRPQSDPKIRGALDARILFHNLYAGYEHRLSDRLRSVSSVQVGFQQVRAQIGPDLFFNLSSYPVTARTDWRYSHSRILQLRAGMDIRLEHATIDLQSPFRPLEGENAPPLSTRQVYSRKTSSTFYEPATYLEASIEPWPGVLLLPSLRLDWYRAIQRFTLDPRLTVRGRIFEGTTLKGGVGIFQQPPTPDQVDSALGNPQLLAPRSSHTTLGLEQRITEAVDLDLTGFYKWLDRQVTRNPDFFTNPQVRPYQSAGTGRILGFEAQLRVRFGDTFLGWIAYTFQRSFRKDGPGEAERLFEFDQPHILTLVATYSLGSGWSAGGRFRLVSGNPATPIVGSVLDATSGAFVPIYGARNSERLGSFHQLDLRVDKTWTFQTWKLGAYLDVQNAYNRGNPEGWTYSYDYSQRTPLTGLPILPILGVKGEW